MTLVSEMDAMGTRRASGVTGCCSILSTAFSFVPESFHDFGRRALDASLFFSVRPPQGSSAPPKIVRAILMPGDRASRDTQGCVIQF